MAKSKKSDDEMIEITLSRNMLAGLAALVLLVAAGFVGYGKMGNPFASTPSEPEAPTEGVSEEELVTLTVLNDETCSVCDSEQIVASLEEVLGDLDVELLDISTSEGRALAEKIEAESVPAYVFESDVTETDSYAQIQRYLDAKSDLYVLRVGGSQKLLGREPTEKPTVDLFVMSQCPYGTMAEDNMAEVLDNFGDAVDMNIYFIASEQGGNFSSMHGQVEVNEDIRQVCIADKYPDKLINYLLCVNEDIVNVEENWEACAEEAGIPAGEIGACAQGEEGAELFRENIAVAQELGITGSPGYLVNNQIMAGGLRSPEQVKQMVCSGTPGLEGCESTLSGGGEAQGSC